MVLTKKSIVLSVILMLFGCISDAGSAEEGPQRAKLGGEAPASSGEKVVATHIQDGLASLAKNNHSEASAEFEKALKVQGITPEQTGLATMYLGKSYYMAKKYGPAINTYKKVIKVPDVSNATKAQANILIGNYHNTHNPSSTRSIAPLRDALNSSSLTSKQEGEVRKVLIKALINARQYSGVRTEIKKQLERGELTSKSKIATRISLAKTLIFEQEYQAARSELVDLLNTMDLSDADKADVQLQIGLSYYVAQDYEKAGPELVKVLAMAGSNDMRVHLNKNSFKYMPSSEAKVRLLLHGQIPSKGEILKVLFIGSSHTYRSVSRFVEQIAGAAPINQPRIVGGKFFLAGTFVDRHWEAGSTPNTARDLINSGPWDVVVFETPCYLRYREELFKYGKLFCDLIQSRNAKVVLYEAPPIRDAPYPGGFRELHENNVAFSKKQNVPMAPTIDAFIRYLGKNPSDTQIRDLYSDWVHASNKGYYLAACGLYSTITGYSPVGMAPPSGVSPTDAEKLQKIAWETYSSTSSDATLSNPGSVTEGQGGEKAN